MTVRPFVMWPHKCLRSVAAPQDHINSQIRAIWDDMIDTMYAMPGVGLAAPQIGILKALAVVDCSEQRNAPVRLANPELVWASDELAEQKEGSPNVPEQWAVVRRPKTVAVRYLDDTGAEVERIFEGLWAASAQHQIDHLCGKMFFDRLSSTKRRMILAKHEKMLRKRRRQ